MSRLPWIALAIAVCSQSAVVAQQPTFSTVPTQAVYEYQLNYVLPWQRWYGGPGLSLGGTMPTQGAIGYSSLNGIPLPGPLGAGVYVNGPPPHGLFMPPGPGPMFAPLGMGPVGPMGPMGLPVPGAPMASANPFQPNPNPLPPNAGANPNRTRQRQTQQSPPAARRTSLEQQNQGDEKLRQQLWSQAYVRYRNAADLAPERPEPHFRLGICFAALKQYASAVREFKRSLDLDPTLPQSGETLATIFGPDSKVVETQVMPAVAEWTREDLRDADRLFLLGLILHFDEDPRGSEIMEAGLKLPGASDYMLGFVDPANPRSTGPKKPREKRGPTPLEAPGSDIPPAPLPLVPPLDPLPDPPPT